MSVDPACDLWDGEVIPHCPNCNRRLNGSPSRGCELCDPDWAHAVPDESDCFVCGKDSCDGTCDREVR